MSLIKSLDKKDYRAAFALSKRVEPYAQHNYFDQFCAVLGDRKGFTVWDKEGSLVSLLSYSDFIPGSTVTIHFLQDLTRVGGLTKDVVRMAFKYPFEILYVPRLVSYCIPGLTDKAGVFLRRLGFRLEGVFKEAARMPDGPRDVEIFGILKAECRWI